MKTTIQATNNSVWVIRDETKKEAGALLLPTSGRTKPHTGMIVSVGVLTRDKKIKVGKKALWHPTVGQDLIYEDITYTVLVDEHILSLI